MSRFKSSRPHPLPQDITPGPNLPWDLIGPGESHLLAELEKLYWIGVKHELQNIIQTLRFWQRSENSHVRVPDETDDHVYGFDTFIDQVCRESRDLAVRCERRRRKEENNFVTQAQQYENAVKQALLDVKAERDAMRVRGEVRHEIKNLPKLNGLDFRACMLLQADGFLDIDKITEYRPPRDKTGPKPRIPQLTLSINEHPQPEFHPLRCSACNATIYDSMFTKQPPTPKPFTICCDCYWTHHYGDPTLVKVHKHSILHAIDGPTSRRLCQCTTVQHSDALGRPRNLFPLNLDDRHITTGKLRCPLLDLTDMVAHAKYRGLLASVGVEPRGSLARVIERVKSIRVGRGDRSNREDRVVSGTLHDMDPGAGHPAEDDIPAFFRHRADKNPFGEVHMALRIGPLVIENGVEGTKSGALITLREMSVFHESFQHGTHQPALAVDGSPERTIWQQSQRPIDSPKRYNAIMKQVVGVPFSGLADSEQSREKKIIKLVIEASQSPTALETDTQQELDSRISRILEQLQHLLAPRVKTYLSSITSQLLTSTTTLTWNPVTNNCTLTPAPKSKYDIPPGHIDEYLTHTPSSDLIDTLTQYSTDWASFPQPLYPHQELFPWDCTEGYARCPTPCGSCNLAKHVWAFPFDSWSLVSMHLGRERCLYPNQDKQTLSWLQNRLSILTASWLLTRTATSMARSSTFVNSPLWIHQPPRSSSPSSPSIHSIPRVKTGGVHRAQPNSHSFELGTNAHFFLATWAGKSAYEQRSAYEKVRGERMRMQDVLSRTRGRFRKINTSSSSTTSSSSSNKGKKEKEKKKAGENSPPNQTRAYKGFEGEDSTRFTGNFQIFYNASYTPFSDDGAGAGGECVDAQFASIVGLASIGQFGADPGYDPATDPGVNCATGCGSSSAGDSGHGGGGGYGGGEGGGSSGGGDGGGGGSSGGGGGDGGGGGGGGGGGDGGG
ncbi:hypothetical protein P170DRAFT_458193 [Aspergillus steynii IBT 23096]|uniref:ZZ-type domain-containing protein n=1 Tax=Aspergillus steynii IBT 23096 TaxID=1392250 RepID=A0A2I2FZD7_9EURO|nr:uncharacterized protein P170DRAFT_458193 [Aspergillus steynii IBT 23096]PLB45995.1 hypothetical protein P170DRAFT_458193 [Aspergillus steynii IBT 23096]